LLAAGVTPDFPRPAAAASMAWHGHVLGGLLGGLFAMFAIRLMNVFTAAGH
jgi:predicted lipid-binding transport protein (Tim44 family)